MVADWNMHYIDISSSFSPSSLPCSLSFLFISFPSCFQNSQTPYMAKLQFWPFTFNCYSFYALLLVPAKFPLEPVLHFLKFTCVRDLFFESWQWLFSHFLFTAFCFQKFNVFMHILKSFPKRNRLIFIHTSLSVSCQWGQPNFTLIHLGSSGHFVSVKLIPAWC